MRIHARPTITLLAGTLMLSAIALAYWPGLAGGFVFDDFANLDVLGGFGDPWRWPHFLFYITSGSADPTGRPVALITFLLDGDTWPTDPWTFKRSNLVLHLLNTGLLAWTIARLQSLRTVSADGPEPVHRWVPLAAAALWGAHPFFVSTTLYVVQREAMLPMTFILLAILAWGYGVRGFRAGSAARGWCWCIAGFGVATLLAGLSKANGFLAPLLTGLCYLYFLRPDADTETRARRQSDAAALVLLALPSMLLIGYLINVGYQLWGHVPLANREWSLPERLLSQPRALWDYTAALALPRSGGGGVFVEGFIPSRGWLEPVSTIVAFAALLVSIVAALWLRRRWPAASFAWLFFLGGHLLESSTIPLELYFEHRNYVPAMFLGWPLAQLCLYPGPQRRARVGLGVILICACLALTHQRAVIWGDPVLMNAMSASHEADSARAQSAAAQAEMERGEVAVAIARIREVLRENPDSIDVAMSAIGIECQGSGELSGRTFEAAQRAMLHARRFNFGHYVWLQGAAESDRIRRCSGFETAGLESLIDHAERNPISRTPARQRDFRLVRGHIALARKDADAALARFNEALTLAPEPKYALVQAAALGNAGYPDAALRHLEHFDQVATTTVPERIRDMASLHQWLLHRYRYYDVELADLRRRLEVDAAGRGEARDGSAGAS
jgi:tetratricopeptide (TPR) repeat protein